MVDIIIIAVPGLGVKLPQAAPALLKGSVESAGFTCKTIDFNIRFYNEVADTDALDAYFGSGLNVEEHNNASELVKKWVDDILELNPKFIGISVFTYQNRVATKLFCQHIRKLSTAKIILGGQGLSIGGILGVSGFGKLMYDEGLTDFWVRSEGEVSLVEILKNNINYPGINSDTFKQIDHLDDIPFPNYDDYNLDLYSTKILPVTGSRGCVRSCSFCDIHDHWKYRYRSGKSMTDEILYLHKKYNVNAFTFTDSLINGNLKEFKKFIKNLANHNKNTNDKITWTSQFIVRSDGQVDDEYWEDIANSGGTRLLIGVETGSDRVRLHMNKKFSNKDLDYTMRMLKKYNITCAFLIMVGYPTETDDDFQETLDMFDRYKEYIPIIDRVHLGGTLGILPGTPLYNNAKKFNIELDKHEHNWIAYDNKDLTLSKRIARRNHLKNHLSNLGYFLGEDMSESMLKILDDNKENFEKRIKIKEMIQIKNAK